MKINHYQQNNISSTSTLEIKTTKITRMTIIFCAMNTYTGKLKEGRKGRCFHVGLNNVCESNFEKRVYSYI